MIEFIIGISIMPLLIMCNVIILNLCVTFPKYILGISGVMVALDAVVTIGYTFTMKGLFEVEDMRMLVGGIGLAIFIALFHKVTVMQKTFNRMFSNEIGN